MIQVSSLRHNTGGGAKIIHSHKLTPRDTVTIFCIIEWKKENVVSILEDHLLEILSAVEWNSREIETDFSYIAEHFNHFIKNIPTPDLVDVSIVLACNSKDTFIFSTIWTGQVLLVEENTISLLTEWTNDRNEFHSISSWEIPNWWKIYFSSSQVDSILGEDIILELSSLDESIWIATCENILKREYTENIHIYRLNNERLRIARLSKESPNNSLDPLSLIQWVIQQIQSRLPKIQWNQFIRNFPWDNKAFQYSFLSVWVFILFILLYILIRSITSSLYISSTDSKNQLLEAQDLIEQSQKLINNPTAFNLNIKKAEWILFNLRDKKEHLSDTQDLLSQIEAMKKEVNDIQIIDMSKYAPIIKFNPNDISPLWVFEKNKKFTLIGKSGIIADYVRDTPVSKVVPYPPWETAIWFTAEENGNYYILTRNSRILSPRGNDLTYVTVSGQDTWKKSQAINTFNGNIYLVGEEQNQIMKHKPWMNGFSSQTSVLPEKSASGIIDIGIDGGIYILTQDGKILRYITGKTETPKSLIINKVPGEYTIGQVSPSQLFVQSNLSYFYVLSGNSVWIFQPDSKRYQDVASLTYIAQLEIQTTEEIRSIYVPRDGTVMITTNLGVYEVKFEIVDGKLILR